MNFPHTIELCNDEETEVKYLEPDLPTVVRVRVRNDTINDRSEFGEFFVGQVPNGSTVAGNLSGSLDPLPLCRQFWKAGDYRAVPVCGPISRRGNRLRVHPKFLHSNATSHKWVFGAIAELLDNAIDEVPNGATFVKVDKFTSPLDGNHGLLIQDDGGGMDPESLRRCMSFGFSDKQSDSSIGNYGNGFKTSTMRLGADVIVFSRCMKNRILTQSVGLLSYTCLRQTCSEDIIVPSVDYEVPSTGVLRRLFRNGERQFSTNLYAICEWSPFATEVELLKQFDDMGHRGTKIIVFNLWFNDNGHMELDFESDPEDIMVNGASKTIQTSNVKKLLNHNHIANRLRYSLRVYVSILYLDLPQKFRIILRGKVIEAHHIAADLLFPACISYKPHDAKQEVITVIGFLDGSPNVNVHGFNVYHKNRLILPFLRVLNVNFRGKGKGIAGVLEANFIKPTHDKQDFERSSLYQKLEIRLKDMAAEYWKYHCHLVGYQQTKESQRSTYSPIPAPASQMPHSGNFHEQVIINGTNPASSQRLISSTTNNGGTISMNPASFTESPVIGPLIDSLANASDCPEFGQFVTALSAQTGLSEKKRKYENHIGSVVSSKKKVMAGGVLAGPGNHDKQHRNSCGELKQTMITVVQEHKKLTAQCLEYEKSGERLLLKTQMLQIELQEAHEIYDSLLKSMDAVKVE